VHQIRRSDTVSIVAFGGLVRRSNEMHIEFLQVFRKNYGSNVGKDMENNVRIDLLERWLVRMGSGRNGSGCGQCLAFVKHLWFTLPRHRILGHMISCLMYDTKNLNKSKFYSERN
jgi:hypothetical protein